MDLFFYSLIFFLNTKLSIANTRIRVNITDDNKRSSNIFGLNSEKDSKPKRAT